MTAAFDLSSPVELRRSLEDEVLEYLQSRGSAPAEDVITAILSQHEYLTSAPVVAAIWGLNSRSLVQVGGDWTVTLREPRNAAPNSKSKR